MRKIFSLLLMLLFLVLNVVYAKAEKQKIASLNKTQKSNSKRISSGLTINYTYLDLAKAMSINWKSNWGDKSKFERHAKLFIRYGLKWNVDPVLVASVAYAESRYRVKPILYAKKIYYRLTCPDTPGPCLSPRWIAQQRIVRVNKNEVGMMQVLQADRSTVAGFYKCTGTRLSKNRKRRRSQLRASEVNVCVGAYELSKWKHWATKGGWGKIRFRRRMKPKTARNRAFFARNKPLQKFFWVNFYNWGSNRWIGNGYARKVLYLYKKYKKTIEQILQTQNL